ncbi:HutD/Ves family protein [Bosea vaviloviae]|uniref:HutD-family protein n=1 Tax=Bosea vaviloviae TaxID=1526658 RepID=A0A0N1N3E6_9HYPH|nr:HutD family protein [Bosea vaviloviae]KPH81899.1 hypothetical protein AE618_05725 [Bosea vaviloviae]
MRIIRAADRTVMPWKNGKGITTEIAVFPEGASLSDFDWRISTADVAADGPFSPFPGVDRTLAFLDGNGMRLSFDDGETVALDHASPPHGFDGGRPVTGLLTSGPITDLNAMSRRGRWTHDMVRLDGPGTHRWEAPGGLLVLVAHRGAWSVTSGDRSESLGAGDSAILDATASVKAAATLGGALYVISLRRLS